MALLSVANLVFSYGDRHVLDGVNLTLSEGEHVGLVGRNGCGKSTLMKLIAGVGSLRVDAGQVQLARGATVGYLAQDHDLDMSRTLREEAAAAFAHIEELHLKLEAITYEMADAKGEALERLLRQYGELEHRIQASGGYAVDHQIEATLHGVGLTDELFHVRVADLSGGQRGRLALAKLLLSQPDVLLLDEPTNHLDIAGREWLEEFLSQYPGAVIIISHDRWLLDRVAMKIYELEEGELIEYPGNYAKYRELREQRRLTQWRMYEKQQEKIKREQAFIDRYRAGQRARQAQGREKRLERFVRDELIERPIDLATMDLRLKPRTRAGDLIITAEDVSKGYEGKPLFGRLNLSIKRGERVGIIGPNGAGKSTLINTLLGHIAPDTGRVRIGSQVDVGHYRQTHEHLNLSETVVEYLRRFVDSEQQARDLAGAFLFSGHDQDKPLSVLSGGERSRVVLAGLVAGGHNVLVLDEPTNHLDIPSAERLEEALKAFTQPPTGFGENAAIGGGTLILITHDRMLLEDLVDSLIILDGKGNVRHFLGKYSEYLATQAAAQQQDSAAQTSRNNKATENATTKTREQRGTKAQSNGAGGALSKLNHKTLEERIMKIEEELAAIDRELADPDAYRNGERIRQLQSRREELQAELQPLEDEWLRRAEEA